MELEILEEKHNDLFGRKEIKVFLDSQVTPSRMQVLDLISKKFTCPIENIKITGINGGFGTKNFVIGANIYNSREEREAVELKKKKEGVISPAAAATPAVVSAATTQ